MEFSIKDKKVEKIASQLLLNLSNHTELYVKNVTIPDAEAMDPDNGFKIFLLALSLFGSELMMKAYNNADDELKNLIKKQIVPGIEDYFKIKG